MNEISVGGVPYRIVVEARNGQWVARAERADNGDRFGVDCAGDSSDEARDRMAAVARVAARSRHRTRRAAACGTRLPSHHCRQRVREPRRRAERHRDAEGISRCGRGGQDPAGQYSGTAARLIDATETHLQLARSRGDDRPDRPPAAVVGCQRVAGLGDSLAPDGRRRPHRTPLHADRVVRAAGSRGPAPAGILDSAAACDCRDPEAAVRHPAVRRDRRRRGRCNC